MKKALIFLSLISIITCRAGTVEEQPHPPSQRNAKKGRPEATRRLANSTTPALKSNEFTFKLYSQLAQKEGTLFFSPASIETALSIPQQGAAGTTKKQFDYLLPKRLYVPSGGTNITLESANALWIDKKLPILNLFRDAVREQHAAQIRFADFATQPETERKTINAWVEEKTHDNITDLLPTGSVSAMTRLILVNAIYFKGDWLHAFDPEQTAEAPFWTAPNRSVPVPLMRQSGKRFNYGENDSFQTLELPYQGRDISMLLILPRQRDGLGPIEESLDAGQFNTCFDGMTRREVNVFLPRFKIESTFPSMKNTLSELGLTDAFDAQRADFSGISDQPLFLSDVVHKAFVEVNEQGTEAAAATGIIMRTTSLAPPPATFRADRPFIFVIRENESENILFIGRVVHPGA